MAYEPERFFKGDILFWNIKGHKISDCDLKTWINTHVDYSDLPFDGVISDKHIDAWLKAHYSKSRNHINKAEREKICKN